MIRVPCMVRGFLGSGSGPSTQEWFRTSRNKKMNRYNLLSRFEISAVHHEERGDA